MKKIIGLSLAVFGYLFAAMPVAQAVVIDFESTTTGGCQANLGGSVDGFTLDAGPTGGGFNTDSSCSFLNPTAYSGDKYMINYHNLTANFTRDADTFTLNSLFVHADIRVPNTTVTFQGLDAFDNVLYSMQVGITTSWQQVNFSGWDNVKTFTWGGGGNISIDDFEYNAEVPEPSALLLFGLGLIGLRFARKNA